MTTYQKNFIAIITQRLPENEKLVDFISRLIHIGREASYRRIRCEVEFTLSEVVIIAKALNINLTSLIIREGGEKVTCNLRLIEEDNVYVNYSKKIEADLNVLEGFDKRHNLNLYLVNNTIPDIFFANFPSLTKLRLLKMQFHNDVASPLSFDQLVVPDSIKELQLKYWNELKKFELAFILGPDMVLPILNDIQYFIRFNLITTPEKQLLKQELSAFLDVLNEIAKYGSYLQGKVSLYVSHLSLNLAQTIINSDDLVASVIDLPYTNSILSFDKSFNDSNLESLYRIKKSATLITQSGDLERFDFIKKQRISLSIL